MLQDRAGFTTLALGLYDTVLSALQAIEVKDKTSRSTPATPSTVRTKTATRSRGTQKK
jgi:hypothetical protein